MKAILLAVKPNQLVKILNGEKTIEVRKSKLPLNIPVYLYCTKGKPYLINFGDYEHPYKAGGIELGFDFKKLDLKNIERHGAKILNGKVVAKCEFMEVEEIACERLDAGEELCEFACLGILCELACLDICLGEKDKGQIVGYAYHISNLEIFDKPKELGEFNRCDGFMDCFKCKYYSLSNNMGVNCNYRPITKAPKSWCYVEEFK